jgi:hypothetical protein
VPSADFCASNDGVGWFYEDPTDRERIAFCDETCLLNRGGGIDVYYGCAHEVP